MVRINYKILMWMLFPLQTKFEYQFWKLDKTCGYHQNFRQAICFSTCVAKAFFFGFKHHQTLYTLFKFDHQRHQRKTHLNCVNTINLVLEYEMPLKIKSLKRSVASTLALPQKLLCGMCHVGGFLCKNLNAELLMKSVWSSCYLASVLCNPRMR